MPENCIYCHKHCSLSAPRCEKGEKMAREVAAGTFVAPEPGENTGEGHRGGRGHGHHGGHHSDHH